MPLFVATRKRLFGALVCGILAYFLLPRLAPTTRAIGAWDVAVTIYLVAAGWLFCNEPQEKMAANARAQREGEWTIFVVTLAVVVMSFVAVLGEFAHAKDLPPGQRGLHTALVVYTLFTSWLMAHVTFCFRYAHEYYAMDGTELTGGLEFPGEKAPDYLDFAYFAVVLGMTFQVSDVQITARKLRRLAALHGLLSFMFNTVIVALTVNIAAGLF